MIKRFKNFISRNTGIIIRIDDIAENMNWDLMNKVEILFEKYSIKPVLGVIPNNNDLELLSYPKKDNFWNQVRTWKDKGWEIAMHGNSHVYDKVSNGSDYFKYAGNSEFSGHSLETQTLRINEGLNKFKREKIKIRTFFAPNHTYDKNTFIALKNCGLNEVIDGYGIMPYLENNIKFVPQLFYKVFILPFGIQSTQIHLNEWNQKDFESFKNFVIKNYNKIISYDYAIKKVKSNFFYNFIKFSSFLILKMKRKIKS